MARNIDPNHFFLQFQFLHGSPFFTRRHFRFRNLHFTGISKQAYLGGILSFLIFGSISQVPFRRNITPSPSSCIYWALWVSKPSKPPAKLSFQRPFCWRLANRFVWTDRKCLYFPSFRCSTIVATAFSSYSFYSTHSKTNFSLIIYSKL